MLNTEFIFSNMFEHRHYHCNRTCYIYNPNTPGLCWELGSFCFYQRCWKKPSEYGAQRNFKQCRNHCTVQIIHCIHSQKWHVDSVDDETLGTLHIPNNPDSMLDNSNVLSYLVDLLFHRSVRKICTRLHLSHIRWYISVKLYYDHNPHSLFCSVFILR